MERGSADRRACRPAAGRQAGARGRGAGDGARGSAGRPRGGRGRGRAPRPRASRRRACPPEESRDGAGGRGAGGRATPRGRGRPAGRLGRHHRGAGAAAHAPRGLPRSAGRRRGGGKAARVPGAGAVARGEHDRVQGERCGDRPGGHRDERRAREVSGAAREPGVTLPPRVVVLAAPSGGGKTTIARELLQRRPDTFGYSVSATTRKPRPGEREGEAYHFLTRAEFQRRVEAREFLEWAEYAGQLYGTLQSEVDRVLASGLHGLLDIEGKGARQVRAVYPRPASVSLFSIPPSADGLIEPFRKRRTESHRELRERLAIAGSEVRAAGEDGKSGVVFGQ